ncbi:MAG: toll/interleukin-1 receptor domain-containing protein [Hyphomicrobiaceae bacterium]
MSYARSMAIQSVLVHRHTLGSSMALIDGPPPAVVYCYDSDDSDWASRSVQTLRTEGFDVFWDRDMDSRRTWSETIEAEIQRADAVLVQWSECARRSRFVTGEADVAVSADKLFMAHVPGFDLDKLPVDFRRLPSTSIDDPQLIAKLRSFCDARRGVAAG